MRRPSPYGIGIAKRALEIYWGRDRAFRIASKDHTQQFEAKGVSGASTIVAFREPVALGFISMTAGARRANCFGGRFAG